MTVRILVGDCRKLLADLPEKSVNCVVTSPPYFGLRDYGVEGQIGLEPTPDAFVAEMVSVFREVRRVLADDGTLWLNLGDSYAREVTKGQHKPGDAGKQNYIIERGNGRSASGIDLKSETQGSSDGKVGRGDRAAVRNGAIGLKPKDLIGVPWRVAFALQADGWYLRSDIIWHKPNPMPESVTDRPTKSHEYLFLMTKSERYYYDAESIEEPCSQNTHARVSQDVAAQLGSERANGGVRADRPMKAVVKGSGNKERKTGADRGRPGSHLGGSTPWQPSPKTKHHADDRSGVSNNVSHQRSIALPVAYRNKRSVWTVGTEPFKEAHFATFPTALIEPCILAGSKKGGVILDPFGGAGTTGLVADRLGRDAILLELNPEYAQMAERRIHGDSPLFADVRGE